MVLSNTLSNIFLIISLLLALTVQYYGSNKCHQLKSTLNIQNQNVPSNNQKNFLKQSMNININSAKSSKNPLKFADLQSGSYTLQKSLYAINNSSYKKNQRYFCFNLTFSYIPPQNGYQIAISFKKIAELEQKYGLDFAIRYKKKQTYVNGLFLIQPQSNWTNVNIWYVITSRYDLRAGSFSADTSNFLNCFSYQQNSAISYTLQSPWRGTKDKNHVVVVAFLSGIRTYDNLLRLTLQNEHLDILNNKILIDVVVQEADAPIEQLFISYFIFELGFSYQLENLIDIQVLPQKQDDVFIGIRGIQPIQQLNSDQNFLRNELNSDRSYYGFGLNQVWNVRSGKFLQSSINKNSSSQSNNFGSSLNQEITFDNLGKILMKNHFLEFFNVKGLVIKHDFLLPLTKVYNQIFANNQPIQCTTLQSCKQSGNFIKSQLDQRGIFMDQCIVCGNNAYYNQQLGYCLCKNGTKEIIPGICIKIQNRCQDGYKIMNTSFTQICTKMDLVKSDKTQNISNYQIPVNQNNKSNYINIKNTEIEKQQVQEKQVVTTNNCPQGMIKNLQNVCICPGQRSYYDNYKKLCQSCSQFSVWNSSTQTCQCQKGSFKIYGTSKCLKCDKNAYFTGLTCVCFPNYEGNGIICTQMQKNIQHQFLGGGFKKG